MTVPDTDESMTGLFSDLVADIPTRVLVPPIPPELIPYARSIRNHQIRTEADRAFVAWLRHRFGVEQRRLRTEEDLEVPCAEPSNMDAYFPDWPDPEEYAGGDEDLEFLLENRRVEIEQAQAKMICWVACPVRELCLIWSMRADAEYELDREHEKHLLDGWSVSGGWGPAARVAIFNALVRMQRDYRKNRMPLSERRHYEALAEIGAPDESLPAATVHTDGS